MSTWLIIAASVVVGILIGFASGYRTGQGQTPGFASDPGSESTPTSGDSSSRPFTESTVDGPVRLEEQPIVPAPEAGAAPATASPAPQPASPAPKAVSPAPQTAGSAPAAPDRREARPAVVAAPPVAAPPPAATGPGSLQVLSRPAGAQIILDGKVVGTTPMTIPDVSAGRHDIRLELPGFNRWATTVEVPVGKSARVAASLEQ